MAENEKLEKTEETDTINEEQTSVLTDAVAETTEETLDDYKALFEQQLKQINEQKKQNDSLQRQINILLRNGASVSRETSEIKETDPAHTRDTEPSENYVNFADLGKELGKKGDYEIPEKKE